MQSNKIKVIALLMACIAVVGAFSVFGVENGNEASDVNSMNTVEIKSNRYAKVTPAVAAQNRLSLEGYEKKLENSTLAVWFLEDNNSLRIVDKSNGYVWGALPEEKGNGMNEGWSNFAASVCTIEYYNSNASESRLSISDRNVKSFYEWNDDNMVCTFNASKAGILFDFEMKLGDNSVSFSLVQDSLQETGDAKLKSLYFMPFLGSAYEDEINGYILIPDGCGALIRFSKSSSYVTGFDSKVYGLDGSIDSLAPAGTLQANRINEYLVDANTVTLPIFGIAHGNRQNAFLGVIEQGAEYSSVVASPAGVVTGYNWATARFNFRQMYTQSVSGNGIPTVQDDINPVQPKLTYYFLNGEKADYSGMASLYREKLLAEKMLGEKRENESVPLRLELIGATVKKGFLSNSVKTLTTADQAVDIISRLEKGGINTVTAVYRGWQKGANEKSSYGKFKAGGNIGGKSGLKKLSDKLKDMNSRFYLYINPITANEDQVYKSSDIALGIDNTFMYKRSANTEELYPYDYYAKVSRMLSVTEKGYSDYDIAYDMVAGTLYSDYSKKKEYTRSETLDALVKVLEKRDNNAFYNPNLYCLKYTDDYFDIPVNNSQYQYETDTVPFLQMVLKGSVDYYSTFVNQGYCSQNTVLKMIEYGTYPSFIVMAADNYQLSNTAMSDYFSLCFDDWEENILSVYGQLNEALGKLDGCSISEHLVLSDGVVRVTYSNGTRIYINYLSEKAVADGVTVPAQMFTVVS